MLGRRTIAARHISGHVFLRFTLRDHRASRSLNFDDTLRLRRQRRSRTHFIAWLSILMEMFCVKCDIEPGKQAPYAASKPASTQSAGSVLVKRRVSRRICCSYKCFTPKIQAAYARCVLGVRLRRDYQMVWLGLMQTKHSSIQFELLRSHS